MKNYSFKLSVGFAAVCLATAGATAQIYTIKQIGLFDSAHTQTGGYTNSGVSAVDASGQAFGTSDRYNGNTFNGEDVWTYSPITSTSQIIGLTDLAHSELGGYWLDSFDFSNAAGQAVGTASRFSGNVANGLDTWLYSPSTGTSQIIGLTDFAHTQTGGYSNNAPYALSANGNVVGFANRFNGSTSLGADGWLYSSATNTTQLIGLTDAAHTQSDGTSYNYPYAVNSAGQAAGYATPLNGGEDVWFYSPTTHTTQLIGLTDSAHTQAGGNRTNSISVLNEAGQLIGTGNRYSGSTDQGQDAWLYSPATNTTQVIGLIDSAHTQTGGYSYNQPSLLSSAGQVMGYAQRFSGSTDQGYDAWFYSPITHTSQIIGLTDSAHTDTDGYSSNQGFYMNASGQVAGVTNRYGVNPNQGYDAWIYSPATNTTRLIGLTDSTHTQSDGFSNNAAFAINALGEVTGVAKRYNGDIDEGQDAWLFDPATNTTYDLVNSPDASGYNAVAPDYLGDDGTVLGYYHVSGGGTVDAFLWTEAGGFRDLGSLVQGGLTAAGWSNLLDAYLADGTLHIYGDGSVVGDSGNQVFALTGVPEPTSLSLLGIGLLARRRYSR